MEGNSNNLESKPDHFLWLWKSADIFCMTTYLYPWQIQFSQNLKQNTKNLFFYPGTDILWMRAGCKHRAKRLQHPLAVVGHEQKHTTKSRHVEKKCQNEKQEHKTVSLEKRCSHAVFHWIQTWMAEEQEAELLVKPRLIQRDNSLVGLQMSLLPFFCSVYNLVLIL